MKMKRKIPTFHNCLCELFMLSQKHGNTVFDVIIRYLLVDKDVTICFRNNAKVEHIRLINIDLEEALIFAEGYTTNRADINEDHQKQKYPQTNGILYFITDRKGRSQLILLVTYLEQSIFMLYDRLLTIIVHLTCVGCTSLRTENHLLQDFYSSTPTNCKQA